jgi:hypothetical protein
LLRVFPMINCEYVCKLLRTTSPVTYVYAMGFSRSRSCVISANYFER